MDNKLDITTIILTYNEEKHIKRCLENVLKFSKKVYVIDSPSTDRTQEYCKEYDNVELVVHKYPGNQAAQFNWALDNLPIETEWTLRLDADEYLSDELIREMEEKLPSLPNDVNGVVMKRDIIFMGKRIKHGKLKTIKLLRLWRTGKGRIENREMDEHTYLTEGTSMEFRHWFYDHNFNGMDAWIRKHLDYANREARMVSGSSESTSDGDSKNNDGSTGSPTMTNDEGMADSVMVARNSQKSKYYKLPLFWRPFIFFLLRYILLGGFLDGKAGFVWNFMQCWWYRTLVDAKIYEQELNNKNM